MNAIAGSRKPITHWLRLSALAMVLALGLLAAGLAWYAVAHRLSTAQPVKSPEIPPVSGVVWGGRVFESKSSLATWLHSRGVTYSTWAARHPALAHVFESH